MTVCGPDREHAHRRHREVRAEDLESTIATATYPTTSPPRTGSEATWYLKTSFRPL